MRDYNAQYQPCIICGTPYERCAHWGWEPAPEWIRRRYPTARWAVFSRRYTFAAHGPIWLAFSADGAYLGEAVPWSGLTGHE